MALEIDEVGKTVRSCTVGYMVAMEIDVVGKTVGNRRIGYIESW